ncbi:NifU family protein [Flavobacterium sp. NKUCC04_CG]|uniref:NifU family protein n=1 Tax=Flavobacterium sp. NKUCC04_CG TaxID=2842121 RepID=UPI001C5BEF4C|nr:NifU family protein [Flavobacterium sp. NKUCC04_CG]MBW3518213.1 NifU family protein [Flavobacterium sp. NKUCC04_CG]
MSQIKTIDSQNPAIVKFVLPDFIIKGASYEFKNIDETALSPLAKQLFYLPFVKTVFISSNFVAIEKFSIVEWAEVKDLVAEQIQAFIEKGGKVILEPENQPKKQPITIYGETTPNPAVLKFVANKILTKKSVEYKNIDETTSSPLAKELFQLAFIKEIFIDENYVSITKYDTYEWQEITLEVRTFIKNFLENGNLAVEESLITNTTESDKKTEAHFDSLDTISQQIINILEEYVKPAVAADGGNIAFQSYDADQNTVNVILQGACSGCPSSTFTLKNGIENMLRQMLNDESIRVEASNG